METIFKLSWRQAKECAVDLCRELKRWAHKQRYVRPGSVDLSPSNPFYVCAIPRGGLPVISLLLEVGLFADMRYLVTTDPSKADVFVDDIIDTSATAQKMLDGYGKQTYALLDRHANENEDALFSDVLMSTEIEKQWVQFPWESDADTLHDRRRLSTVLEDPALDTVKGAVAVLLAHVGEDIEREGLLETPSRVVKALSQMCEGYKQDAKEVLGTVFTESYDQMVILRDIRFTSLCEHHMLPFTGTVDVGYIPGYAEKEYTQEEYAQFKQRDPGRPRRVLGLSKLARLVRMYAKRLQIQERLTQQIAHSLEQHVGALGVGVVVRAQHSCMACRGIEQQDAEMVTSCLLGEFRESEVRAEFLVLSRR